MVFDQWWFSNKHKPAVKKAEIDFIEVSKELRQNKSVTLRLLWEERLEAKRMPFSYAYFALLYHKWFARIVLKAYV